MRNHKFGTSERSLHSKGNYRSRLLPSYKVFTLTFFLQFARSLCCNEWWTSPGRNAPDAMKRDLVIQARNAFLCAAGIEMESTFQSPWQKRGADASGAPDRRPTFGAASLRRIPGQGGRCFEECRAFAIIPLSNGTSQFSPQLINPLPYKCFYFLDGSTFHILIQHCIGREGEGEEASELFLDRFVAFSYPGGKSPCHADRGAG